MWRDYDRPAVVGPTNDSSLSRVRSSAALLVQTPEESGRKHPTSDTRVIESTRSTSAGVHFS